MIAPTRRFRARAAHAVARSRAHRDDRRRRARLSAVRVDGLRRALGRRELLDAPGRERSSRARGREATLQSTDALELVVVTAGAGTDLHAPMGTRELVVSLDDAEQQQATGARSFQLLFGPHNGSTRATLFAGYVPPGKAPWHYHLYDEIVFVPAGPGPPPPRRDDRGARRRLGLPASAAAGAHRREPERRGDDDHRGLHARRQPVCRVPRASDRRRVPLRRVAHGPLDPGRVERRAPAPRAGDRRLGRRPDRRGRAPRARRPHQSGARGRRRARRRRRAARRRGAARRARRRARRVPANRLGGLGRRGPPRRSGAAGRRRLHLPHARASRRRRAPRPGRALRAHGRLVLRHDDGRRAGHLGGRARRPSTPRSPRPTSSSAAHPPRTRAAVRPATTSRARRSAAPAT